jgi:hypothetical protein
MPRDLYQGTVIAKLLQSRPIASSRFPRPRIHSAYARGGPQGGLPP